MKEIKNRKEIVESIRKNFAENNGRRAMGMVRMHKDMLDGLSFAYGELDVDIVEYIENLYYMENDIGDKCLQDMLEALTIKAEAEDLYDTAQMDLHNTMSHNDTVLKQAKLI